MVKKIEPSVESNKPIILADEGEVSFYCNICNFKLLPLGDGFTYECGKCAVKYHPTEEDVRRLLTVETIDDTSRETLVSTKTPEPTSTVRKKVEPKGGLKALQDKGIRVTSYTES